MMKNTKNPITMYTKMIDGTGHADELARSEEQSGTDCTPNRDELQVAVFETALHLAGGEPCYGRGHDTPL